MKFTLKQITKAKFFLKEYNALIEKTPSFSFISFFDNFYLGDLVTFLIYCYCNHPEEELLLARLCVYFRDEKIILNPSMSTFTSQEILYILECNLKYLDKKYNKTYIALSYQLYQTLFEQVKYEESIGDFINE